jgi:endonuclease G
MSEFESASLAAIAARHPRLIKEIRERIKDRALPAAGSRLESLGPAASGSGLPTLRSGRRAPPGGPPPSERVMLEAIVLAVVRPPLLVQDGTFVVPDPAETVPEVQQRIAALVGQRKKIDPVIARTARVELANVPLMPFVGTGWVVEKPAKNRAIMITNRHVAREFARSDGRGGYYFQTLPNFRDFDVRVDFREEYERGHQPLEAPVMKVLYIAGDSSPDIALIEAEGEAVEKLTPIALTTRAVKAGTPIAVVGYPAYDSRNDPDAIADYFGDIFNVKRFAFGEVTGSGTAEFTHDATTLGGNSGSCVFDPETGKAVGIHFAGEYKLANYAVPASEIKAALKGLRTTVVVKSKARTEAPGDGRHKTASFKGRDGYNPGFLDSGMVKPPAPGHWKSDLTDVEDADTGRKTKELKYRHFSVWMCESRKLPLITAVNIDGGQAKRLGRIDTWYIDGRLGDAFQVDNAAYAKNPLDRGHMVRREDPVWGTLAAAKEANVDTFHYTNAAPQHEDLNQRDWVRLEDYILGNARTRGLKVSVFTGPIFGDDDRDYKGLVKLPKSFWKIAAVVNDETGKLSVTGYILAQDDLIKGLTGEFVYGGFGTYQVEVARIGELARLGVTHLAKHDPLPRQRKKEGVTGVTGSLRTVSGPQDLII